MHTGKDRRAGWHSASGRFRFAMSARSAVAILGLLPALAMAGGRPAQAGELDELRALVREQQQMIAAQRQSLVRQQQTLEALGRRLDALEATAPPPAKTARRAPAAAPPPAAAMAAAPAAATSPAARPATVLTAASAAVPSRASPAATVAAAPPATSAAREGIADAVASLPRVPVTSDVNARGMPATPAAAGGVKVLDAENFALTLGGTMKLTSFYSAPRPYGVGTAFFLVGRDTRSGEGQYNLTARYGNLTMAIDGPQVGGYRTGGYFLAGFMQEPSISGEYGFTPAIMYAYADNDRWRFVAGRTLETFSPRAPTMVDAFSILGAAGNPGNSFRAQLKAGHTAPLGEATKLLTEAAISEPISRALTAQGSYSTLTENNGIPNFEGRVLLSQGAPPPEAPMQRAAFEIGASGVYGEIRQRASAPGLMPPVTHIWGGSVDAGIRLGPRLGLSGELYAGQSLGNYLGTITQTVNTQTFGALQSQGGWVEAAYYWSRALRSHVGFGQDTVRRTQLAPGQIRYNEAFFANTFWAPAPFWDLGLEFTWRRTAGIGYLTNSGPAFMATSAFRF